MKRLNGTLVALGLGAVLGLGGSLGFTQSAPVEPAGICHPWNCHNDAECVSRCGVGSVCLSPNTCQSACLCVVNPG